MTIELNSTSTPRSTKACCIVSGGLFVCLLLLGLSTVITGCVLIGISYYKQLPRNNPLYFAKIYEKEYLKAIGPVMVVIGLIFIFLPLALCCLIIRGPKQKRFMLHEAPYHSLTRSLYDLPPLYEQATKYETKAEKGDSDTTISFITVLDYTDDRPPPYQEISK